MSNTEEKRCLPCEGGIPALDKDSIIKSLKALDIGWEAVNDDKEIARDFQFRNYYETMAFVNAIAWMSHYQNHHPDLEVGYKHCLVRYTTHAIEGLSKNDFICAEKVDGIFKHL